MTRSPISKRNRRQHRGVVAPKVPHEPRPKATMKAWIAANVLAGWVADMYGYQEAVARALANGARIVVRPAPRFANLHLGIPYLPEGKDLMLPVPAAPTEFDRVVAEGIGQLGFGGPRT